MCSCYYIFFNIAHILVIYYFHHNCGYWITSTSTVVLLPYLHMCCHPVELVPPQLWLLDYFNLYCSFVLLPYLHEHRDPVE